MIHGWIKNTRRIINYMRASVKRRDLYDMVKLELNCNQQLPNLDNETRWSSAFTLIREAYGARRVMNAVADRFSELQDYYIPDSK